MSNKKHLCLQIKENRYVPNYILNWDIGHQTNVQEAKRKNSFKTKYMYRFEGMLLEE